MSLFNEWKELINNQTEATYPDFWESYSGAEKRIYSAILGDYKTKVSDTLSSLASGYEATDVLFMGFLDGINTSLVKELKLDKMTGSSKVSLDIDFEKHIEKRISTYVRTNLSFCVFQVDTKEERLFWERKIASTLAKSTEIKPSANWLGNNSPKEKIRASGLWQVNELKNDSLTEAEFEQLKGIISKQ